MSNTEILNDSDFIERKNFTELRLLQQRAFMIAELVCINDKNIPLIDEDINQNKGGSKKTRTPYSKQESDFIIERGKTEDRNWINVLNEGREKGIIHPSRNNHDLSAHFLTKCKSESLENHSEKNINHLWGIIQIDSDLVINIFKSRFVYRCKHTAQAVRTFAYNIFNKENRIKDSYVIRIVSLFEPKKIIHYSIRYLDYNAISVKCIKNFK
ncbi:hypothetical protein A0H76_2297 [Hepatospora eriocheir]|uniref:Uncharacterized protein n=1 Tax=Hepatospora eriocheir TaxID=1081669 RepID=A0A1X0QK01_9MICR|nr:hypothetical protein A0H76_2297 [Hepatospora eriocheir]